MKKFYLATACLFFATALFPADEQDNAIQLTLQEAIALAQLQSVDAAVALNEWKTAYWEYRTHQAEQLPEVNFTGTLPSYTNRYSPYQESDGSYTYVQSNWLGLNGKISIDQNVSLTGGKLSLNTSLDFTRQLGGKVYSEFMSIPVGVTFTQPVFGVNDLKWKRRIEPVRYKEAKAAYVERMEGVTLTAIAYFFNLLHAKENLGIAVQNLRNAGQLYEIAIAKRRIGHISESELMQLNLGALQAKGIVTEAQSNLNARMFQLRSFLGLSEDDMIEPVVPEWAPSLRMRYQEVLEKAQENNSFAKNIIRRQLEADYAVATAKGNRRSINLYASIGYTGKDLAMDKAYSHLRSNQIVEVGVNIPLTDWGKRKGKVKVAESNREVVLSRIRQEQMNFNQDIFLLAENFNNQAGQLEIARQADLIAARRYSTSIETFMIGKINILDLNDAQKSKDEARLKHIEELYKYWNYYYNIRSVALYDFQTGRNLDPPTGGETDSAPDPYAIR
ncbi:MAG: TolC family protein [Tannerellaceae bacterium]|jgi:outer membrane protein TolC|nr:TolC family protein [Tannerellaceae bacterium]